MKKAQAQSGLPRSRPSSGSSSRNNASSSSSSSRNGGGDDRSLDMRSLDDTLPETSALRRSGPPPKMPNRRASLDQQKSPKVPTTSRRASLDQQALRKPLISPRVSVSNQSTVSSTLGKHSMRKEGGSTLRKASTKKSDDGKNNGKEVQANIAASLPMDSLCLCLEKLQSVYHVVTCASVCRHWREAVLSDVVGFGFLFYTYLWFSDVLNLGLFYTIFKNSDEDMRC